ncbi:MAG: hypothetical protein ACR2QA_05305 [Solirubrobacteraceae bacterium]
MYRASSPRLAAAALYVAVAIAVGGCGHVAVVGSQRPLTLALSEYRLNPSDARARAGPLTILAHNYGRMTHNLAVTLNGMFVGVTKPIPSGQSAELMLSLAPGTYLMTSTLLSDQALGEYGTLTITR